MATEQQSQPLDVILAIDSSLTTFNRFKEIWTQIVNIIPRIQLTANNGADASRALTPSARPNLLIRRMFLGPNWLHYLQQVWHSTDATSEEQLFRVEGAVLQAVPGRPIRVQSWTVEHGVFITHVSLGGSSCRSRGKDCSLWE